MDVRRIRPRAAAVVAFELRDQPIDQKGRAKRDEADDHHPPAARNRCGLVQQLAAVGGEVATAARDGEMARTVALRARSVIGRRRVATCATKRPDRVKAEAAPCKVAWIGEEDGEGERVAIAMRRQPILHTVAARLVPHHEQIDDQQFMTRDAVVGGQRGQHPTADTCIKRGMQLWRRVSPDRNVSGRVMGMPSRAPAVRGPMLFCKVDDRVAVVAVQQAVERTHREKRAGCVITRQPECGLRQAACGSGRPPTAAPSLLPLKSERCATLAAMFVERG